MYSVRIYTHTRIDTNTHELFIFDWHNQSKRRGYIKTFGDGQKLYFFDLFGHFFIAYNVMDFISFRPSGGKRTQAIYLWCCCYFCCTPLFSFFSWVNCTRLLSVRNFIRSFGRSFVRSFHLQFFSLDFSVIQLQRTSVQRMYVYSHIVCDRLLPFQL